MFKDQAFGSDIFRDGEEELTFNSFYDVDANGKAVIKEDKVELFLQNLGVEAVEDSDEGIIDDEAGEQTEDGIGNSKHKSLKSVSFPDGTEFSVNNMTHFEVYLEALKKMGLDLVYPLISNMKYAGETNAGISLSYNATGSLSSRPTCMGLQANLPFVMSLYLLKSVPITLATDGIKNLSMLIPRTLSDTSSVFLVSMVRIWLPKTS